MGALLSSVYVVGQTMLSKATSATPVVQQAVIRIPPPTPEISTPTPISQVASPSSQPSVQDLLNQIQQLQQQENVNLPVQTNGWTISGSGDVTVSPKFSTDNKTLTLDFLSRNFSRITAVDYNLSYIADPQVTQVVKGSFAPNSEVAAGEVSGVPYLRKTVTLGTCSGQNCVYDTNPRGFTLKVQVKTNNGLSVYLITLTLTSI
ncbi:hypothetical protein HY310_00945 [Candidatus Microgenomates bacterium]|nr:hypothetical protein [Candidatus Microgenomates bacterium]